MVWWLAGLLLASGLRAAGPGLEEILNHYYDAMGGLGALGKLESIRIKAIIDNENGQVEAVILKKRPNKVRILFTTDSSQLVQGYDGQEAWWVLPGREWSQAEPMPEEYTRLFVRDAHIDSALVNYKQKGVTLELLDEEMLAGNLRCHRIRATLPGGQAIDYLIDAATFHERQIRSTLSSGQHSIEQISIPSDYRKVDGLTVAFRVVNWAEGKQVSTITVREVQTNVGALDAFFRRPGPPPTPPAPAPAAAEVP